MSTITFKNGAYSVEFKNISKEALGYLETLLVENGCEVLKKEWRSKYNSYVVYDYEPFCSDGFEIAIVGSSRVKSNLEFINYIYKNKVKNIDFLKNCLAA